MSFPFPRPFPGPSMVSWGVLSLFSIGEQGAWYDPSDFSTMFQDAAGTTPVTAVEQPVGLLLDKSKGLALGSEVITNAADRDFSSDTGFWTKDATATISGGVVNVNTATDVYPIYRFNAAPQGYLEIRYTITVTSGAIRAWANTGGVSRTASGTYTDRIYVSVLGTLGFRTLGPFVGTIDDVSVKQVQGNHASQSTAASRPVLSARVNLLTYSEQFDNAAWTKGAILAFGSGSVANATEAPNGTITADFLVPNTTLTNHAPYFLSSLSAGVSYTASIYAKVGGYDKVVISDWNEGTRIATFDLTNVTAILSGSGATVTLANPVITSVGNGWYRCSVQITKSTSGQLAYFINSAASYAGNGTSGLYLWGADLRVTNVGVNLPAYQRVAAATDYDTSGFPLYLKFDGVDDSLVTGTIDPGGVDKAQVFAGVRKLSDAGDQAALETTAAASANNGAISLFAPVSAGANYNFGSRGTTFRSTTAGSLAAPITTVVTGLSDISGDSVVIRANGVHAGANALDQGTGNYASAIMYIGRRAGTTLPFNGQVYSMIVRFSAANLSDAQIASTETYVNSKTGAY